MASNTAHCHVKVGQGGSVEVLGLGLLGERFGTSLEHPSLELVLFRLVSTEELGCLTDSNERVRTLLNLLEILFGECFEQRL